MLSDPGDEAQERHLLSTSCSQTQKADAAYEQLKLPD